MAFEYDVNRQGWRVECGDKCVLAYNGQRSECILIDISLSGVLVSCDEDFAESIQPGDTCGIYLCNDPLVCATEVTCNVTRRDAAQIGLQFLYETK